jgi:hypothetical protein
MKRGCLRGYGWNAVQQLRNSCHWLDGSGRLREQGAVRWPPMAMRLRSRLHCSRPEGRNTAFDLFGISYTHRHRPFRELTCLKIAPSIILQTVRAVWARCLLVKGDRWTDQRRPMCAPCKHWMALAHLSRRAWLRSADVRMLEVRLEVSKAVPTLSTGYRPSNLPTRADRTGIRTCGRCSLCESSPLFEPGPTASRMRCKSSSCGSPKQPSPHRGIIP